MWEFRSLIWDLGKLASYFSHGIQEVQSWIDMIILNFKISASVLQIPAISNKLHSKFTDFLDFFQEIGRLK